MDVLVQAGAWLEHGLSPTTLTLLPIVLCSGIGVAGRVFTQALQLAADGRWRAAQCAGNCPHTVMLARGDHDGGSIFRGQVSVVT